MSRHRRILLVVLAAAMALGLIVGLGRPPSSPAITGPATIRVIVRQIETARVDVGRTGRSPGDMELQTGLAYNTRVTPKSIGQFQLACTFVRGMARVCDGALELPRGDIVVGGSIRHRMLYELAVLGGTGLYDNARGTLTVTRIGMKPTRELLLIRLAG
jgi:hypothetical protein